MHDRPHIQVDQVQLLLQVGVGGEGAARPDPGVQSDGVERAPESVLTGRTIEDLQDEA